MSEVFLDSKQFEKLIEDSNPLKGFLRDREFIKEHVDKVMTNYKGKVTPLILIRGLEYWVGENHDVSDAIERKCGSDTLKRKCLLHYFAIYVYAVAVELRIVGKFGLGE